MLHRLFDRFPDLRERGRFGLLGFPVGVVLGQRPPVDGFRARVIDREAPPVHQQLEVAAAALRDVGLQLESQLAAGRGPEPAGGAAEQRVGAFEHRFADQVVGEVDPRGDAFGRGGGEGIVDGFVERLRGRGGAASGGGEGDRRARGREQRQGCDDDDESKSGDASQVAHRSLIVVPGLARQIPQRTRGIALIGALTLFVAALMLCLDGTRDGDLYLQLASGRYIATHGLVSVDPFRTIAHGEPWLNQQWLSELLAYRLSLLLGVTGLTVGYAVLLAAPLGLLLWLCRRKGLGMMIALAVLYCPGLWTIVHPRAAGFSLFAFSLLVVIVALAWMRVETGPALSRLRWAMPAALALFALWANLHGGFPAGLLLIAVVVAGLLLDRWRGERAVDARRVALLATTGLLAACTVLVATPLGYQLIAYLASFGNSAISLASSEWRPALQSPAAILYLAVAAAFVLWLWTRRGSPALTPVLVAVVFLALAALSLRNVVFVGPVIALAIVSLAPDRPLRIPLPLIGLALLVSATAAATWAAAVGPARNEPILDARLIDYALGRPPPAGHIAAYAGIGSYMLWRSPRARVELDGWLEHFSAAELRDTYAVLDGRVADPLPYVRRLRIGAAIVDRHRSIRSLREHGFRVEFHTAAGTYLVKARRSP